MHIPNSMQYKPDHVDFISLLSFMKFNQLLHIGSLSAESSFTKREWFFLDASYNFLLFSMDMLCVS